MFIGAEFKSKHIRPGSNVVGACIGPSDLRSAVCDQLANDVWMMQMLSYAEK